MNNLIYIHVSRMRSKMDAMLFGLHLLIHIDFIMLMCIELMLLAISFLFLINSIAIDNITGQIFTIMILTIAAAESAIGLAILVAYYRIRGTIAIKTLNLLRG